MRESTSKLYFIRILKKEERALGGVSIHKEYVGPLFICDNSSYDIILSLYHTFYGNSSTEFSDSSHCFLGTNITSVSFLGIDMLSNKDTQDCILQVMQNNSNVTEINFHNNDITDDSVPFIEKILQNNPNITKVNIDDTVYEESNDDSSLRTCSKIHDLAKSNLEDKQHKLEQQRFLLVVGISIVALTLTCIGIVYRKELHSIISYYTIAQDKALTDCTTEVLNKFTSMTPQQPIY